MTTLADGSSRSTANLDVAQRADGVLLIGASRGSGYRVPPALVQRGDGQVLQLTPLLYAVLSAVDGRRSDEEIAAVVGEQVHRAVSAADVGTLIDGRLRPLGLLRLADGSEPEQRRANPLLALRFRYVVADRERARRFTAPFAALYHPVIVTIVTLAFAAVGYWVLFRKGLASAAHQAFADPGMLLVVFAITVISAGFHEFGHAAALRRGGGTPGAMGAGLYLVWPAFYTDVTDSYRLGRAARLRTDLGGLYFNALVALAMFAVWVGIGWDGLLLVIATQILQMIRQLPPLLRFDGYHVLADLTGVPDLYHRIGPTLASLWPSRWHDPRVRVLRPWVRAVVTLWVLLVVPLMAMTVLVTVLTLPRILATAGRSFATQWGLLTADCHHGAWAGVAAKVLALVAIAIPILGVTYMIVRLVRRLPAVWRRTQGRPLARAVAVVTAAAVVAGLLWAWWPRGNYRAIQANERGVLTQAFQPAALHSMITRKTDVGLSAPLHNGQVASAHTVWPGDGTPLPRPGHPRLVMVLRPRDPSQPTWVFPFNRPAPPGPGGNQAMAIATRNGSVVYDVAFALVTTSKDIVLNRNEAYAFASCRNCAAVAVSFQVVLVIGSAHVVAPQNISAAVSYNCVKCVTAAMALQLDVSLTGQPDASTAAKLQALWNRIRAFAGRIPTLSLSQVRAQLEKYEQQILTILGPYASQPTTAASSSAGVPAGTVLPSAGSTPSIGAGPGEPTAAAPSSSASTSAAPSAGASQPPSAAPSISAAPTPTGG